MKIEMSEKLLAVPPTNARSGEVPFRSQTGTARAMMTDLPREMIGHITHHLPSEGLISLAATNKYFSETLSQENKILVLFKNRISKIENYHAFYEILTCLEQMPDTLKSKLLIDLRMSSFQRAMGEDECNAWLSIAKEVKNKSPLLNKTILEMEALKKFEQAIENIDQALVYISEIPQDLREWRLIILGLKILNMRLHFFQKSILLDLWLDGAQQIDHRSDLVTQWVQEISNFGYIAILSPLFWEMLKNEIKEFSTVSDLARLFRIRLDYKSVLHANLQFCLVNGPAGRAVGSGEPVDAVARRYGIDDQYGAFARLSDLSHYAKREKNMLSRIVAFAKAQLLRIGVQIQT